MALYKIPKTILPTFYQLPWDGLPQYLGGNSQISGTPTVLRFTWAPVPSSTRSKYPCLSNTGDWQNSPGFSTFEKPGAKQKSQQSQARPRPSPHWSWQGFDSSYHLRKKETPNSTKKKWMRKVPNLPTKKNKQKNKKKR